MGENTLLILSHAYGRKPTLKENVIQICTKAITFKVSFYMSHCFSFLLGKNYSSLYDDYMLQQ